MALTDSGDFEDPITRRLASIDWENPVVDTHAVESALRKQFDLISFEAPPVRWVVDAVEGYRRAADTVYSRVLETARQADLEGEEIYKECTRRDLVDGVIRDKVSRAVDKVARTSFGNDEWEEACERELHRRDVHSDAADDAIETLGSKAWRAALNLGYLDDTFSINWETCRRAEAASLEAKRGCRHEEVATQASIRTADAMMLQISMLVAKAASWTAVFPSPEDMQPDLGSVWMPFVEAAESGLYGFWILSDEVIAVPRPFARFQGGLLHSETGPAIWWPSGVTLFYWKGVVVSEEVVLRPGDLSAKRALEARENEVCRVMIERIGPEEFLSDANVELVYEDGEQVDNQRSIYRIDRGELEPIFLLRIHNASAGRASVLFLPDDIQDCEEAIEWSVSIDREGNSRPLDLE